MILRSATEQTIINVSGKMAAGGSVTAVGSGFTGKTIQLAAENPDTVSSALAWADIGVICGIAVGAAGFASQFFFNLRRDRRDALRHNAEMAKLLKDDEPCESEPQR